MSWIKDGSAICVGGGKLPEKESYLKLVWKGFVREWKGLLPANWPDPEDVGGILALLSGCVLIAGAFMSFCAIMVLLGGKS